MEATDWDCPHCELVLSVPHADHVDGKLITCPHCGTQLELRRLPSPTRHDLEAWVWDLKRKQP